MHLSREGLPILGKQAGAKACLLSGFDRQDAKKAQSFGKDKNPNLFLAILALPVSVRMQAGLERA